MQGFENLPPPVTNNCNCPVYFISLSLKDWLNNIATTDRQCTYSHNPNITNTQHNKYTHSHAGSSSLYVLE